MFVKIVCYYKSEKYIKVCFCNFCSYTVSNNGELLITFTTLNTYGDYCRENLIPRWKSLCIINNEGGLVKEVINTKFKKEE